MSVKTETIFCCPMCKGEITEIDSGFACGGCDREYPVVAGIADFRICADPYIDIPSDRAKALRIAAKAAEGLSFAELVAFYYSITPEVPDDLARHYLNHHVAGTQRGEGILNRMLSYKLKYQAEPGVRLLDLGCGTGGFLAAASKRGAVCYGADVALRWLVIAQSRFRELGCDDVIVVCACADHLPFAEKNFDVVVAENLIEHCSDTGKVLSESRRVSKPDGAFLARTINRFAMGPEPHVGVWGVGYLPRNIANAYVKLFKGIPYEHIHLDSFGSLNKSIRQWNDAGVGGVGINSKLSTRVPLISESDYKHHPWWKQQLFKTYGAIMQAPVLGSLLAQLGPYIDVASNPEDRLSKSV